MNVYVEAYDQSSPRIKVSPNGGMEALWHPNFPDTPELFYRDGRQMIVAELRGNESLRVSRIQQLFEGDYVSGEARVDANIDYAVAPEGDRFIMLKDANPILPPVTELKVIVNWFDELELLVPTKEK